MNNINRKKIFYDFIIFEKSLIPITFVRFVASGKGLLYIKIRKMFL